MKKYFIAAVLLIVGSSLLLTSCGELLGEDPDPIEDDPIETVEIDGEIDPASNVTESGTGWFITKSSDDGMVQVEMLG